MTARRTGLADAYDYIIVGGGAAGCAMAARLSERAGVSSLLIEAGGEYKRSLSVPLVSLRQMTAFSWKYFTSQQKQLGQRRLSLPFGKVLGGSSSINAMMYVRGSGAAYDRWADLGNAGWSFAEVLPYFLKSERFAGGASEMHGGDGPIDVSPPRHRAPFSEAFIVACLESGIPRTEDFNCVDPGGAGFFHVMQRRGRRASAASAYLAPARRRENLTVETGALVCRAIIESGRATGVELVDRRGISRRVHATREVIVAAGAFNSPRLLMLSGIGPEQELRRLGIKLNADLPGVGSGLQDHVRVPVLYESTRRSPGDMRNWLRAAASYAINAGGVLASNCCESGAILRSDASLKIPDLQFVTHFQSHLYPGTVDLQFCLMRVASQGRVTLSSADLDVSPVIDPNYLSEAADVRACIAGIRLARHFASSAALRRFGLGREIMPGSDLQSDAELEAYCRSVAETCYHPAGSCRMGSDPMAVVDAELRVHGIDGLRIVDASVMPDLPNGNTCAAVYMIAEKAADLIAGAAGERSAAEREGFRTSETGLRKSPSG